MVKKQITTVMPSIPTILLDSEKISYRWHYLVDYLLNHVTLNNEEKHLFNDYFLIKVVANWILVI